LTSHSDVIICCQPTLKLHGVTARGGGNNGVLATFHFPVCKSITAPPHDPPWDCRHMYLLAMPAVPKLLWARLVWRSGPL